MAVAHDAASQPTTTSANAASFSWTHTPSGTPRGVLVFVYHLDTASNLISSVTYGGVTMTPVSGGSAVDSAGEPGRCDAYFLGSGIPTGGQTVVVNRTNNANVMDAAAVTVQAATDTGVHIGGIVLLQGDGTVAEQSVTDGSTSGTNSVRYAGGFFGHQTPPTTGASSTGLFSRDPGATAAVTVRETTAGTGARNVGMSSGTTDDRAAVHLAIKEYPDVPRTPGAGAATLSGLIPSALLVLTTAIGAGGLGLTGYAPTVDSGKRIDVPAGTLVLKGPANPPMRTLALEGYAPTLSVDEAGGSTRSPGVGALSLTGYAPSVGTGIVPDAGALSLSGLAPVASQDLRSAPGVGALTLSGLTPALDAGVGPPAGALVLSGQTPQALQAYRAAPDTGSLAFAGQNPTLSQTVGRAPDVSSLSLSGFAPTTLITYQAQPGAGQLTLTGQAPQAFATILFLPDQQAISLTGLAPSLVFAYQASPAAGTPILAGQTPALDLAYGVAAGSLTLAGHSPTATATDSHTVTPDAGALRLAGSAPTISGQFSLAVDAGTLSITGAAPVASLNLSLTVGTGTLTLDGQAPSLPVGIGVAPGALVLEGQTPSLALGQFEVPDGALTLVGYAPAGQIRPVPMLYAVVDGSFGRTVLDGAYGQTVIDGACGQTDIEGAG